MNNNEIDPSLAYETQPQPKYQCIHEELLQDHTLQINTLNNEIQYKKQRLDELKTMNNEIKQDIKEIKESVNKIILSSKKDDEQLNNRITKLETRQQTTEDDRKNDREETNKKLAIIGIILVIIQIYFNYFRQ